MPTIIGITGYKRAGKDTVAQLIIEAHAGKTERYAFGDAIRSVAYGANPWVNVGGAFTRLRDVIDDIGWERAKDEIADVRLFLELLGTEGVRDNLGADTWTRKVLEQIGESDADLCVISDVRTPDDAQGIRALGGVIVDVRRPGNAESVAGAHRTAAALDAHPELVDVVIVNDGSLEDLRRYSRSLVHEVAAA